MLAAGQSIELSWEPAEPCHAPLRRAGAGPAQGVDLRPAGRELGFAHAPCELGARPQRGLVHLRLISLVASAARLSQA